MNAEGLSRADWRTRLREARRQVAGRSRQEAARRVAAHLCADPLWQAEHIALYLSNDGELDTSVIVRAAREANKRIYLPVISASAMQFCEWREGEVLQANRYGIGEPRGDIVAPRVLELLLLPTVGWTSSGFRLGMGGGFYDRFLAANNGSQAACLGLAYECQRDDALDSLKDSWDQPLNGVLTESGLTRF